MNLKNNGARTNEAYLLLLDLLLTNAAFVVDVIALGLLQLNAHAKLLFNVGAGQLAVLLLELLLVQLLLRNSDEMRVIYQSSYRPAGCGPSHLAPAAAGGCPATCGVN